MNEQKTFDSWHIVTLMNQSRSSSFVYNFVIFFLFFLFWICCFICEFHFQSKQKNLDSFVFTKLKMYQNPLFEEINSQFSNESTFNSIEKKIFDSCWNICESWKTKKKMMKHYLIKCFETWFNKTTCCINENYMTKNTIMKTIWWTKQSTSWNKLCI